MASSTGDAAAKSLALVAIVSGIVGLVVVLGLQVTRAEEEIACFALGAITLLGGAIGLVAAIRLWYPPMGNTDAKLARLPPLGIAAAALALGVVLMVLGVHAVTVHHHGPAPHVAHADAMPKRSPVRPTATAISVARAPR